MKIEDARKLPAEAQEAIRRKAVKAVLDGEKKAKVAALFGVTRQAVTQWVKGYQNFGQKALKAQKRGRPKGGKKLLPWQAAQSAKMVTDRHPEQLKLPFYLWTRQALVELIEKRFGVRLSIWTAGRYLKSWGFTPQKPIRKAYEQNPEAVERWLKQQYPAIRRQAQQQQATIFWGDEMSVRSDHAVGRSYGRRGQTPVVPVAGRRFSCHMISAITNLGQLQFMVFKNKFVAKVFKAFLGRLIRQNPGKIFLIVDQHPVHRSSEVRQWLQKQEQHIRLYFLPGYSPELNPDELLNQDVKSNAVGRKRPRDQKELLSNTRGFLHSRQKKPGVVQKYFHGKHVRYAA